MGELSGDADLASVAAVVADRGRARMLLALGDGRSLAASTLAMEAGVAPSTASAHLARLVESGLCRVEKRGRHRYYELAGSEAGALLEALARVAPSTLVRSLREGTKSQALRAARTCYDHLAGRLGTAVMTAMLENGWLAVVSTQRHGPQDLSYCVTDSGRQWIGDFGLTVPSSGRRPLVLSCLDWTEQQDHLAGALGAALLARLLDCGWLRRTSSSRALKVTEEGRLGLLTTFGVQAP